MIKIIALFVMLLLVIQTNAQTRTITGKIIDSIGKRVEGASITIKGSNKGIAATSDGTFSLLVKKGGCTYGVSNQLCPG